MSIFFTDGQEILVLEISNGKASISSNECNLLVYKASRVGPSGFDRFPEGQLLVERMLKSSTVLSSGLDSVPLIHTCERPLFEIVRREASPGCISFRAPDAELQDELKNLQRFRQELKKRTLRTRYGLSPPPEPQATLRTLFQEGKIDSIPLELVLQHSSDVCIWRWGEFGLHFLSLSRNKGGSIAFIEEAAQGLGIELIRVNSIREIPSW